MVNNYIDYLYSHIYPPSCSLPSPHQFPFILHFKIMYPLAGYNVVIVESVGLGQSEVEIDNAVDMLVMIVPPGGGDGLQVRCG